jgi:hypothetical protein
MEVQLDQVTNNNNKYYQKYLKYKTKYISLKQKGGNTDEEVINKIKNAIETGDIEALKKIDTNTLNRIMGERKISFQLGEVIHTPLTYSVMKNNDVITKYLLNNGAKSILSSWSIIKGETIKVHDEEYTETINIDNALRLAIKKNNLEIVQLLLDEERKDGITYEKGILTKILILAIQQNNDTVLDLLINNYESKLTGILVYLYKEYENLSNENLLNENIFKKLVELITKYDFFSIYMLIHIFELYRYKFKLITVKYGTRVKTMLKQVSLLHDVTTKYEVPDYNKIISVSIDPKIHYLRDLFCKKINNKYIYIDKIENLLKYLKILVTNKKNVDNMSKIILYKATTKILEAIKQI